jgi:hypothetical protein
MCLTWIRLRIGCRVVLLKLLATCRYAYVMIEQPASSVFKYNLYWRSLSYSYYTLSFALVGVVNVQQIFWNTSGFHSQVLAAQQHITYY